MNKDNKQVKTTEEKKQRYMDIGAWTIVIVGIVFVIVGILFGIISMSIEIANGDATVGIPELELSLSLFIATLIAFGIIFLAVYFLLWDKIKDGLDKRQKNVAANIAIANYKAAQAEKNYKVSEKEIATAEAQGKEIISESKKKGTAAKKEIVAEAKTQSEDILVQAREQLERERQQMESQIRKEILETSLLAAEKIIEKELDADANKKMIEELIESLK